MRSLRSVATSACSLTIALGFGLGASPTRAAVRPAAVAASGSPIPAWLALRPGTAARVDEAPWPDDDEPEAALTESADSLHRDFSADFARPGDVVYEPIGVRVRIVRVLPGARIALVRPVAGTWRAYAPVDRIVPEIPAGTRLRAAGGFAGYADFYEELATPKSLARPVATGTPLEALAMAAAPHDPASGDLVRVRVRVLAGPERGRTGWITAGYTGLAVPAVARTETEDAKACSCRIVRFEAASPQTLGAVRHNR